MAAKKPTIKKVMKPKVMKTAAKKVEAAPFKPKKKK